MKLKAGKKVKCSGAITKKSLISFALYVLHPRRAPRYLFPPFSLSPSVPLSVFFPLIETSFDEVPSSPGPFSRSLSTAFPKRETSPTRRRLSEDVPGTFRGTRIVSRLRNYARKRFSLNPHPPGPLILLRGRSLCRLGFWPPRRDPFLPACRLPDS